MPFMFSNPMHASGILPDRYRLRHLVTCESRCKYFPFLSHFLPIAAGQPGTITRRRRRDPVSQPDGGGGRGRHRIGPVSQIAADGADADGVDGRMTSLPIYLLRGERGARRNLICRTRLAYHVRDIHSTPKPIRRQALSFPIRICNELVQRFSPIKGVESWTLPDCRRYASKTA